MYLVPAEKYSPLLLRPQHSLYLLLLLNLRKIRSKRRRKRRRQKTETAPLRKMG